MLTRRRFCELGLAGVCLHGLRSHEAFGQGLGTDYDVIVVGAGVSGLVAAQRLAAADEELKVLVLESRDRIGGRIHSISRDLITRRAELGALQLPPDAAGNWPPMDELGLQAEEMPDGSLSLYPGMSALLDAISTSSQGTVQLSSEVTEIFWREGLVGVNYRNRSLDSAVTARRLIVTIPPSVLRRRGPSFTPALPGAKLQAMEEVVSRDAISVAAVFPADSAAFVDDAQAWANHGERGSFRAFRAGKLGEVLIEAQFRGSRADLLSRQPDEVVFSMALREYGDGLVTVPAYEEALWTERVNWAADPDSRGARLEAASARTRLTLAESVGATLFFAGDTTVAAAGVGDIAAAFASGERVAGEVAQSLDLLLQAPDANEPILDLL